jgi:hypothetical protein
MRFKRGDFVEDTFGQHLLDDVKKNGMDAWLKYGSYLYYP